MVASNDNITESIQPIFFACSKWFFSHTHTHRAKRPCTLNLVEGTDSHALAPPTTDAANVAISFILSRRTNLKNMKIAKYGFKACPPRWGDRLPFFESQCPRERDREGDWSAVACIHCRIEKYSSISRCDNGKRRQHRNKLKIGAWFRNSYRKCHQWTASGWQIVQ